MYNIVVKDEMKINQQSRPARSMMNTVWTERSFEMQTAL